MGESEDDNNVIGSSARSAGITITVNKKIEDAVRLLFAGDEPVEVPSHKGKRGRPKLVYKLGHLELTPDELREARRMYEGRLMQGEIEKSEFFKNIAPGQVWSDEDLQVATRLAYPMVMSKAYGMALESDRLDHLLAFMREMGDRAFGKAVQSVRVMNPKRDLRLAWKEQTDDPE